MIYEKVFPLADALQLEIQIFNKGRLYDLRGERTFSFPLSKGSDLKIKAKIEASTLGDNHSAVFVQIMRNFWVYLVLSDMVGIEGVLTLFFVNMQNQNSKAVKKAVDGADFNTAMMALKALTVATFTKGSRDIDWVPVTVSIADDTCVPMGIDEDNEIILSTPIKANKNPTRVIPSILQA